MTAGNRTVDDATLAEHEGLVRALAARARAKLRMRVDMDDLVQLGMVGLLEAAERYDPESGVKFSSFAYTRIRGAMFDGIGGLTGVKRGQVRLVKRLAAANEFLESHDHAEADAPDTTFVASAIQGVLLAADMAELIEDRARADEQGSTPLTSSPERSLGRAQLRTLVLTVIDELPEDEATLLRAHYLEGRSLVDIGVERGISRSWASRVHTRALARAKRLLAETHGIDQRDISDATFP